MTFEEAYKQLEKEFEERVDEDYRRWSFESVFLQGYPNVNRVAQ